MVLRDNMQLETHLNLVHSDKVILGVVSIRDPKMSLWNRFRHAARLRLGIC